MPNVTSLPPSVQMDIDAAMLNAVNPPPIEIGDGPTFGGKVLWKRYQVQSTGAVINAPLGATTAVINMRAAQQSANQIYQTEVVTPYSDEHPAGDPLNNQTVWNGFQRGYEEFVNAVLSNMNLPAFPFPPVFGP